LLHQIISAHRALERSQSASYRLTLFFPCVIFSTFKMEARCSSETLVYNKLTRRHIPENGILHSHRRENLKSYVTIHVHSLSQSTFHFHVWTKLTTRSDLTSCCSMNTECSLSRLSNSVLLRHLTFQIITLLDRPVRN
jgi:hypothetical protein